MAAVYVTVWLTVNARARVIDAVYRVAMEALCHSSITIASPNADVVRHYSHYHSTAEYYQAKG